MNGSNATARRRSHVPPFGGFNDRAYGSNKNTCAYSPPRVSIERYGDADDGGQGKTRRKQYSSILRRILNRSRWFDVILIVASVTKLASVLYYRHKALHITHHHVASKISNTHKYFHSSSISLPLYERSWIDKWRQKKMPFNTPVLYRHNDYYSDEYRGMFRSKYLSDGKRKNLDQYGYVTVDDMIYHADEYRGWTDWALHESGCRPQSINDDQKEIDMSDHAVSIGFSDHHPSHEQQLYIDDAGDWDAYYAFDDDYVRSAKGTGLHEKRPTEEVAKQQCMRPAFYNNYYPTCNEIHSTISGDQWLLSDDSLARHWESLTRNAATPLSKYLGSGYYRNAFLLQKPFIKTELQRSITHITVKTSTEFDEVVFKSMKQLDDKISDGISEDDEVLADGWAYDPTDKYSYTELMEDMRKDAMVMELLTSSPRSANIYSHCALSSVIEFAPVDIEDYIMPSKGHRPKMIRRHGPPDDHGLLEHPVNDHIVPFEKLAIALEMAKCIAEMHGFVDGPIANVDVQAGQFFRGRDGIIKLVDFNRAEALLYDIKADKYCKFVNGAPTEGMFRAPEENIDAPLTEKIDVFSLGNVFYSVLTGIMVHVNVSSNEAHRRVVEGITEPIPDFYYEEPATAALAEAITLCWTYDAEYRPTIFEIVTFLERAVKATNAKYTEQTAREGRLH